MDSDTEINIHPEKIVSLEEQVRSLYEADQSDRKDYSINPTQQKGLEVRQRDEQRLKQAREILEQQQIFDPETLNRLAYFFQHGDTVEDYKTALYLTTKAVELGLPPESSLIPAATDRLMIQEQLDNGIPVEQLKQKYGTQVRFFGEKGEKTFTPPLDGLLSGEDFKKFGLSSPLKLNH